MYNYNKTSKNKDNYFIKKVTSYYEATFYLIESILFFNLSEITFSHKSVFVPH